ncbi:hypothetical protein [Variovorax sp. KK3]|uniref:hypothetical protein n=1 Tax=Variovorax sp. KK3 TaxID=1855728 RepID=UPI00097C3829|nr:hypothetical protein [Variovorax sp. KK3]
MFKRLFAAALVLHTALFVAPAVADEGHSHDAPPSAASGPALPRFAAVSELFELVGVVNGKQLTIYLDRFADNAPVKGASIQLDVGGAAVALEAHGEGEFEGTLAQELKAGLVPVTATVVAGDETDILAGELDVHEEAHADAATTSRWKPMAGWIAAAALAALALAWLGRRGAARRRLGGAA